MLQGKRIVIAHNWRDSGIESQNYQLAFALSEKNTVWFLSASRVGGKKIRINNSLTVLEWPNKRPTKLKDFWYCYMLFKKIKPDVVMAHFTSIRLSMPAAFFAGVRFRVAWYHIIKQGLRFDINNPKKEKWLLLKYKFGFFWSNIVVSFSEFARKEASDFLKKSSSNILVIPNGFSIRNNREEKSGLKIEPVFLFLGRLQNYKGVDIIIRCFQQICIRHPNVKLLIVGDGPERNRLEQLVKHLDLEHVVKLEGKTTSHQQVFEYLNKAYALLVPSKFDNFPTVIIEAFASKVPVIGSRAGGIPDMIENETNGFLCDAEDENQWIEKIEILLENEGLRSQMASNAKKTYETKFTIDNHVNRVTAFLNSLNYSSKS